MRWVHRPCDPLYTATYRTWRGMLGRCYRPDNASFKNYGARNISVCEEWKNDFDRFVKDMGIRPDGHTIERKDVNGNYTRENCTWVPAHEQGKNQRSNHNVTYQGKTQHVMAWAKEIGVKPITLYQRLSRGSGENSFSPNSLRLWKHGTRAGYENHKCRCGDCVLSNTRRMKEYRQKRKLQYDL